MVEVKQEFKDRLKIAMDLRNMKAVDIAKRLGVKEGTISHYKSGYSKPKRDRLIELASILMVDPAWLMGLDVSMLKGEKHDGEMGSAAEAVCLDMKSAELLIERLNTENRKKALRYMENLYQLQLADSEVIRNENRKTPIRHLPCPPHHPRQGCQRDISV